MLMFLMSIFTLTLMKIKNPFMGSLMLIALTVFLMLDISFAVNHWLSYLLMLLFLGGMMVMFLYVTSIMTTLKFNVPKLIKLIPFFILAAVISFIGDGLLSNNNKFIFMSDLFNYDSSVSVIFIFFYLLMSLVAVVKISKKFEGSLKSKVND